MTGKINLALSLSIAVSTFCGTACQATDLTTPTVVAEDAPLSKRSQTPEPVIIAAVGDIMLGSTSIDDTFLPPNDGRDMLNDVALLLQSADIAFGNLEGPLIDGGETTKCPQVEPPAPVEPVPLEMPEQPVKPVKPIRCFAFRSPTRYAKHLKEAGFDILSLANNHALDFGDEGRISTRKALDEIGIAHAGSAKGKHAMTVLEARGQRIAFVAFAHNAFVPNVNDLPAAQQFVRDADKIADIVVVSFHGGSEGANAERVPRRTEMLGTEKRGNLPLFARTVIDAGADLVLGHGPHVLRGMEVYKGRLVVYSMGNFATYGMFNLKDVLGLAAIFELKIDPSGKFLGGKVYPVKQIDRGIPVLDPEGSATQKLRALSIADFGAAAPKIADDGTISPN